MTEPPSQHLRLTLNSDFLQTWSPEPAGRENEVSGGFAPAVVDQVAVGWDESRNCRKDLRCSGIFPRIRMSHGVLQFLMVVHLLSHHFKKQQDPDVTGSQTQTPGILFSQRLRHRGRATDLITVALIPVVDRNLLLNRGREGRGSETIRGTSSSAWRLQAVSL